MRALLNERLAWTHAVNRKFSATARALDGAVAAINELSHFPEPDYVFWADALEIDIMAGCYSELGRPARAVPLPEDALSRYDDTHSRDKALYSTWLAHALMDADDPERAAYVAEHAIDLASGVG